MLVWLRLNDGLVQRQPLRVGLAVALSLTLALLVGIDVPDGHALGFHDELAAPDDLLRADALTPHVAVGYREPLTLADQ